MEVVCDQCVVACVNHHSIVPALKSIANRAYCDFQMEIFANVAFASTRTTTYQRINVINIQVFF